MLRLHLYMTPIEEIQLIGSEVAVRWSDGFEAYFPMDKLRAASPSAETAGERDLLGVKIGGDDEGKDFSGVTAVGWNPVGGYGIQFRFSDGHQTGIYSFDFLRELANHLP
ncbi:MAG: DUF971 domain-containing protein [Verrucomicrobiota bacterium]